MLSHYGMDAVRYKLVVGGTRKFYDTQVYSPADGALEHLDVSFTDYPTTLVEVNALVGLRAGRRAGYPLIIAAHTTINGSSS